MFNMTVLCDGSFVSSFDWNVDRLDRKTWRLMVDCFLTTAFMEQEDWNEDSSWQGVITNGNRSFVKVLTFKTRIVQYPETAGYLDVYTGNKVVSSVVWFD